MAKTKTAVDETLPETPEERKIRKAAEAKAGPVPKAKKQLQKPNIKDLYPWAVNRSKAERAHIAVHQEIEASGQKVTPEDTEQQVMDHYTSHGGLVRGYEKLTTIGRKKPIIPGATTDDVITDETGAGDDEDDD